MRAKWLREISGVSRRLTTRILGSFIETGLAVRLDGRLYLPEGGMDRAANLSRIPATVIRRRTLTLRGLIATVNRP